LQPDQLDCGAAHLQHPLSITTPLSGKLVLQDRGLTSVAVSSVSGYTVVFLGTASGQLLKINLDSSLAEVSRHSIPIARGEPVHHIMQFDPVDPNYLYLMTSHHMTRVRVAACEKYQNCNDCLGARDAYCGWCTMEARCSLEQECRDSQDPQYWTSTSEGGVKQCPSMTIIPDKIDIASETKSIIFHITGNIPNLRNMNLSCDYGNNLRTPATISYYEPRQQWAHCCFLPKDRFPDIPPNQDHVRVRMAVTAEGTSIIWHTFVIYNCMKTREINPKTPCTSCLTASWSCYWCVDQHLCVSNSSECGTSLQNSTDCPRITATSLSPAPTAVTQDLRLPLSNINMSRGRDLECDFGAGRMFPARWINSSAVECSGVLVSPGEAVCVCDSPEKK
ncbi:hypothetical protein FKM82_017594, partial [Ascaphus truei]